MTTYYKHLPEYRSWQTMIDRCTNARTPGWKYYGGRGISVCCRWRNSFKAFLADMGPKPDPSFTIDRINNHGDYEPGNCRWATRLEQAATRRRMPRACWRCGKTYAAFGLQKYCSTACRNIALRRRQARAYHARRKASLTKVRNDMTNKWVCAECGQDETTHPARAPDGHLYGGKFMKPPSFAIILPKPSEAIVLAFEVRGEEVWIRLTGYYEEGGEKSAEASCRRFATREEAEAAIQGYLGLACREPADATATSPQPRRCTESPR